jgi:CspA family cold shock protein
MLTGTVKFFNHKNKFGFIKCIEDGKEYYVHAKNVISDQLNQDDKVEFELKDSTRGPEAIQVKKIQ